MTGSGVSPSHTYAAAETYTVTLTVTDNDGASSMTTTTATISASGEVTSRGDTYATPVSTPLSVTANRIAGVLYNDFDTDASGNNIGNGGLTAQLVSGPTNAASFTFNPDGSFSYTPNGS